MIRAASRFLFPLLALGLTTTLPGAARAAKKPKVVDTTPSPWAEWVEPDFPFFSSVLDARTLGDGFPKDNLVPRGLILDLGHNLWACFDTDLVRIACVWQGEPGKPPVTQNALAPGSYHIAGAKTKDGQDNLPKIIGTPLLANGIYPGLQAGEKTLLSDPREPAPSKEEVGRGPLPEGMARFLGLHLTKDGVEIETEVSGVKLALALQAAKDGDHWGILETVTNHTSFFGKLPPIRQYWSAPPAQGAEPTSVRLDNKEKVFIDLSATSKTLGGVAARPTYTIPHWPQVLTTSAKLDHKPDAAYAIDDIALPLENPWKRNVRLADIAFLDNDGHAAGVTMDGDVWLISGLKGDLDKVTWKRFASGLHEPMSIVARPEPRAGSDAKAQEIFVYDRGGIWKLSDTTGKGEVDRYEMFCNLFAQTAETREFPNSMKLAPDGSFVISKGGQQGTTLGKHNGTVIRVAPDGKSFKVIGWGLRQPFVGVNPKTGLVTASDQEGNYVPTTPIHFIRDHQYYGFLTEQVPHEVYPQTIADPVVWIPHSVNASGATQVWLYDAKMGALNDECIHLGYNRPEVFRVLFSDRFKKPQATVVSFTRKLEFAPLNGVVNPADGQLYVVGFQIWGTTANRISGLARIRYTGKPRVLLKEATPMDKGVLLRFTEPVDKTLATNPANYSVERWNYKRTFKYGSPQLKLDGTPGTEWMSASSAYLSADGLKVFIGVPDMKAGVMQMRVGWGLKGADGLPAQNSAYLTPYELAAFDPAKEGFGNIKVDLTPRQVVAAVEAKPTVDEGRRLYEMMGCMACHSIDGKSEGKVGPTWRGLYGTERLLKDGHTKVMADDAYLRESMLDPSAKIVKGYEKLDTGMPIYAGVLNESQIKSLILFIKSLK